LVVLLLWLPLWFVLSYFYMSPHCDLSSHNLCNVCQFSLYYFVFLLILILVSAIVIPFSHNIATSLCCCNVDHFIPIVTILRYVCKPTLNTVVRKSFVVGIYKPWANFWNPLIVNLHPLNLLLLHVFQLHVYLLIILSLPMTFAKCLSKLPKNIVRKFWHVIMALLLRNLS
jgi:hypothetical protein